jgi:hypothetical protein
MIVEHTAMHRPIEADGRTEENENKACEFSAYVSGQREAPQLTQRWSRETKWKLSTAVRLGRGYQNALPSAAERSGGSGIPALPRLVRKVPPEEQDIN